MAMRDLIPELVAREGNSIAAAARAAGVSEARYRWWLKGRVTEDAMLRCWLALHPTGRHLLLKWRHGLEVEEAGERQASKA